MKKEYNEAKFYYKEELPDVYLEMYEYQRELEDRMIVIVNQIMLMMNI